MQKFLTAVNALSKWSGIITSFLIVPMILIIVFTSMMRYFFSHVVDWGFETSLFVYGMHFMLGGAYCLHMRSHVIVDILPSRLPFRGKKITEAFGNLVVLFVAVMLTWLGTTWAWKSTMMWERSAHQTAFDPPIWWYKWVLPISAALLGLQALADTLAAIGKAVGRDKAKGEASWK